MDAPAPFGIAVSDEAGTTVVSIVGELDLASVPSLQAVFEDVVQQRPASVAVDMQGVSFLDSSGISVLVQAHKQLTALGAVLSLRGVGDTPRRVLEVSGLSEFFALAD